MKRAFFLGACVLVASLAACGDDSPTGSGGAGGTGSTTVASTTDASTTDASSSSASTASTTTTTGGGGGNPFAMCEKTGESNSTGAGPGDQTCFAEYACTGAELTIECDGNADGSATCTCTQGADTVLGTCDEPTGADCEFASSCCKDIVG